MLCRWASLLDGETGTENLTGRINSAIVEVRSDSDSTTSLLQRANSQFLDFASYFFYVFYNFLCIIVFNQNVYGTEWLFMC